MQCQQLISALYMLKSFTISLGYSHWSRLLTQPYCVMDRDRDSGSKEDKLCGLGAAMFCSGRCGHGVCFLGLMAKPTDLQ